MPRPVTPTGGSVRSGRQGGVSATPPSSAHFGGRGTVRDIHELRERVAQQDELIEKQGSLLLGHAQLIHEMRGEIAGLRDQVLGASHATQLAQVTASTLAGLTQSVDHLHFDTQRIDGNVTSLARHVGCESQLATRVDTPETHPTNPPAPPASACNPRAAGRDDSVPAGGGCPSDLMLSNISHVTPAPDVSLKTDLSALELRGVPGGHAAAPLPQPAAPTGGLRPAGGEETGPSPFSTAPAAAAAQQQQQQPGFHAGNPIVSPDEFATVLEGEEDAEEDDLHQHLGYPGHHEASAYHATPMGAGGGGRRQAGCSVGASVPDIGADLYSRGMAQKKRREAEIAQRKRSEEAQEKLNMRRKPEITTLAKRSKSAEGVSISARTDEWRERRERKRETLRTEMQRLEDASLRPKPELNPKSLRIAHLTGKGGVVVPQRAASPRSSAAGWEAADEQHGVAAGGGVHPGGGALHRTPERHGGQERHGGHVDDTSDSPPPLDELLERLRKRREMLGLCTSESPGYAGLGLHGSPSPLS